MQCAHSFAKAKRAEGMAVKVTASYDGFAVRSASAEEMDAMFGAGLRQLEGDHEVP